MKFSIVVTAYNVEAYIVECLESLKRQTFTDFQVTVVDDCSSDATFKTIESCIAGDSRFTALLQPSNQGPSAARNVGIDQSQGEFMLFLDGDDYYAENTLGRLAAEIKANKLDMLYFAAESFYASRKLRRTHYENQEVRASVPGVYTGPEMYVLMEETNAFRPSSCLYTVRREIIQQNNLRYVEGILHEDLLFQMLLIPHPRRVAFINEPLYQRRMREGSIMTTQPTMKNVHGLAVGAQLMQNWLLANYAQFAPEFCQAYAARIADTREVAAGYLNGIDAKDVESYRASLTQPRRIEFDMYVLGLWRSMKHVNDRYANSHAYRIGHALIAVPQVIRRYVELPKAKPGE
jgi:glycosyltransferase involved in cell wall biosynthesis